MHWEAGTVWQPWSCSCSADARCPISYSQHSTKQNYSTLAATNTQTCARTHTHTNVCIYTHTQWHNLGRERKETTMYLSTPDVQWSIFKIIIKKKKTEQAEHLVLQLTLQVECLERCGQISIYIPTLFFAIIIVLFLILIQWGLRKAVYIWQEKGSLPSSLTEADLSHT